MRHMRLLIPILCVFSVNAAEDSGPFPTPSPTPTPTDSMSDTDVTSRFSGIRLVLEENLVKNEEYKNFFIGAIASLADTEKDAIRGFTFNDKGSDLLLESLEARNMSMYELSFRITLGTRDSMDKFNVTFVNATKTP